MIPTSTDVSIEIKNRPVSGMEVTAVFVPEGASDAGAAAALLAENDRQAVARLLASGVSRGKSKEIHFDLIHEPGKGTSPGGYRRVIVAGLGKPEKVTTESIRQAAGALAKACRKHRLANVAAVVPALDGIEAASAAEAVVTGFLLGNFHYAEYKGDGKQEKRR